jgi:hypothetical protein
MSDQIERVMQDGHSTCTKKLWSAKDRTAERNIIERTPYGLDRRNNARKRVRIIGVYCKVYINRARKPG